jgi:hypothetical protein
MIIKLNLKKNKIFFLIYITFNNNFSDVNYTSENNNEKIKKNYLNIIKKNSKGNILYEEKSENGLILWNEDEGKYIYFYNGIIEEIIWEQIPEEIKEIVLKETPIKEGDEVDWYSLKLILIKLNNIFKTNFVFKISKVKDFSDRFIITFSRKPSKKYFFSRINIVGNQILKTSMILKSIEDIIKVLDWMEKAKYLILGSNNSEFIGNIQTQSIENAIKNLSEKHLILGTKVQVFYEFNPHNDNVIVHINVEEGKKYFIDKINIENFKFSISTLKNIITENGMQNNSFEYLSLIMMEEYSIPRVNINYSIDEEDLRINLFLKKEEKDQFLTIENIQYNILSIPLNTLIKNIPIRTGDLLDEWLLKYFCYKLSHIFETKITYEIIPCSGNNKVVVKILETVENVQKDIISADKGFIIQYPFKGHRMEFSWYFTPKISIFENNILLNKLIKNKLTNNNSHSSLASWGGGLKLVHKYNLHTVLDILDLNIFFNFSLESKKLLKSLQGTFLKYINQNKEMSYYISFLNLHQFFHYLTKDHLKGYMYFYGEGHINKTFKINYTDYFTFSAKANIFYKDLNGKISLQPEFHKKLWGNFNFLISFKILFCSQDYKNPNETYKHFSAINNKRDNIMGLLWDYHDNENETKIKEKLKSEEHIAYHNYLLSKSIVLSNAVGNLRFMLLYEIFKIKLPHVGPLLLYLHLFLNLNYDISHNLLRLSYGGGLMGTVNNIRLFLSLGALSNVNGEHKEHKNKEDQHEELHYAFSFEGIGV